MKKVDARHARAYHETRMKFAAKFFVAACALVFALAVYAAAARAERAEVAVPDVPEDTPAPPSAGVPLYVTIPAIELSAPVAEVGLNRKGEMDVPSGATGDVGWYRAGAMPGGAGSAVLDAHVYAAFKHLHRAAVGDDIYVDTREGARLHFKVESAVTYALADVPRETLFNRADKPRLNLITCAGAWDGARGTYTHRLVVYAALADA